MDSELNRERFREIPLDSLGLDEMASGHASLVLTSSVSWEDFPDYALTFVRCVEGRSSNLLEAADVRIAPVYVEGEELRLVFEDYPQMISLESTTAAGDRILYRLFGVLKEQCSASVGGGQPEL